jgi:hypothetical protein
MNPRYIEDSPITSNPILACAVSIAFDSTVIQRYIEAVKVTGRAITTTQEITFQPG